MKIDESIDIQVNEGVYSPDEDSYLLIDILQVDNDDEVLEIGVGSGIISLHCAKQGAHVTSVDKSDRALENTRKNAELNDIDLNLKKSDLFKEIKDKYNVIVFNPPYLPKHEDLDFDERWDGGERGDEVTVNFLENVKEHLKQNGRVYLCFSNMSPLNRIRSAIDKNFDVITKKEKKFRFETLYAYELELKQS